MSTDSTALYRCLAIAMEALQDIANAVDASDKRHGAEVTGLDDEEFTEMAYENVRQIASNALAWIENVRKGKA